MSQSHASDRTVAAPVSGVGGLGVWVWQGNNLRNPLRPINAASWGLPISSSQFTRGDYNNDGLTDIALFTDLTGGRLRAHVIYSGQWNAGLQQVWDAPGWSYPIGSMRIMSGHVVDSGGGSDMVGFLDYGSGHLGVWVWRATASAHRPGRSTTPPWGHPITNSRFATDDSDGDGLTDISVLTDGGNGDLQAHAIYGSQQNLSIQQVWDAPGWAYPISNLWVVP
jgi:hypothetical protein